MGHFSTLPSQRKELVRLDSRVIFLLVIFLSGSIAYGIVNFFHHKAMFQLSKAGQMTYTELLRVNHEVKLDVVAREGVTSWDDTTYAKSHPELPKMSGNLAVPK